MLQPAGKGPLEPWGGGTWGLLVCLRELCARWGEGSKRLMLRRVGEMPGEPAVGGGAPSPFSLGKGLLPARTVGLRGLDLCLLTGSGSAGLLLGSLPAPSREAART